MVAVRIDDDVRAEGEAGIEARLEGGGEALVARVRDDVRAEHRRDGGGLVRTAVVDDDDLNLVDAGDRLRQVGEDGGEALFLVVARYLNDQFHARAPPRSNPAARRKSSPSRISAISSS